MRWNRFVISIVLLLVTVCTMADSIYVSQPEPSRYDKRVLRYRKHWAALIPTQFVIQNAGNMGVISAGIGWHYGKQRQWETHLLWGYIPKHQSTRGKLTMTLKENYIPWSIDLKRGWSIEPLSASIYLNTTHREAPQEQKYHSILRTQFLRLVYPRQIPRQQRASKSHTWPVNRVKVTDSLRPPK